MKQEIILVTTRSFSSGRIDFISDLKSRGFEVVIADFSHDLQKLTPLLGNVVAWIAGVAPITEQHLRLAKDLKIIARYGVGYEAVDLEAAEKQNILITNTPGANSNAVAEHAIALLFSGARKVVNGYQNVLKGSWQTIRGQEISDSQIGVVGFGQIGRLVVSKLVALGANVSVVDPYVEAEIIAEFGAKKSEALQIAKDCEFIILQAPGGQQIVDDEWLSQARIGQIIINTARADLVNEKAIAKALFENKINYYAADALEDEQNSPLLSPELKEKVLITAHIAAQTDSAIDQMGSMAVANVLAVLGGSPAINPIKKA